MLVFPWIFKKNICICMLWDRLITLFRKVGWKPGINPSLYFLRNIIYEFISCWNQSWPYATILYKCFTITNISMHPIQGRGSDKSFKCHLNLSTKAIRYSNILFRYETPSIQLSSKITTFLLIVLLLTKVPLNSFEAHQSHVISYQQSTVIS